MNLFRRFLDWMDTRRRMREAYVRQFQRDAEVAAFFSADVPDGPGPAADAWFEWHDRLFGEDINVDN